LPALVDLVSRHAIQGLTQIRCLEVANQQSVGPEK
jgi:hypothetical protein